MKTKLPCHPTVEKGRASGGCAETIYIKSRKEYDMRKLASIVVVGCLLVLFSAGCAVVAPVVPPQGMIYSSTRAPISTDFVNTPVGSKHGEASAQSVLGLIATGDCSIQAGATAGGLKTITHVDYEYFSVLGVFTRTTVIVYGD